jgi:hypothetical protein
MTIHQKLPADPLRTRSLPIRALFLTIVLFALPAMQVVHAQTLSSGYVFAGATFGSQPMNGAGRFGMGLDFRLTSHFDLGGEIGTIFKNDVGVLGSANLSYHFTRPQRHERWDPFLVIGVSAARFAGSGGAWMNLGAGVNYWLTHRAALRGEFKGYAGGQDLGGFGEFRFGVTFRP